jgi:hypothetical protein
MPHTFPGHGQSALMVGRTPWSAADAPVGLFAPHDFRRLAALQKVALQKVRGI